MNALPIQLMKHHDRSQIKRSARSMLWGSVLAMILSCALFAGATHAWFSDRCSAQITLQSAKYFGVEVKVVEASGEESTTETKVFPDDNGVYHLESGTYTVTLTWVGDKVTGGYHVIKLGNDDATAVYYSPNLTAETTTVSFQLVITEQNSATLTPVWSDNAGEFEVTTIVSGDPISYPAVPQSYAMRGTEPEPDEPAEPGTPEPGTPEPGTPEPGTPEPGAEEKNNSEEVPSGTDSGSSETGETDDEGSSPEVKQPEVIPETSPAEASEDSSENQ